MFEHKIGYIEWLTEHFYRIDRKPRASIFRIQSMDHVWMVIFIVVGWSIFLAVIKKKYAVIPTTAQQVMEAYHQFVANLAKDIIGPEGEKYVPLLGTLGLFILTGNLMGLIPIFKSPTSNINVTFACAIIVFIYYHVEGVRRQGILNYLKHFAGPVWWLAIIFVPIEIIGHFARPLVSRRFVYSGIFSVKIRLSLFFSVWSRIPGSFADDVPCCFYQPDSNAGIPDAVVGLYCRGHCARTCTRRARSCGRFCSCNRGMMSSIAKFTVMCTMCGLIYKTWNQNLNCF